MEKEKITCEICGVSVKTPQALSGHKRFKHADVVAQDRATVKTPTINQASVMNDGELSAKAFEYFEKGLSLTQVIIKMRRPAEVIKKLYLEWFDSKGFGFLKGYLEYIKNWRCTGCDNSRNPHKIFVMLCLTCGTDCNFGSESSRVAYSENEKRFINKILVNAERRSKREARESYVE